MKLSDYMKAARLTDAKFAEKINRDRAHVSRLRRGVQKPSFELAEEIARVTGGKVKPNDFMGIPVTTEGRLA